MKKRYLIISFIAFIICMIVTIINCKFESYVFAAITLIIFLIYVIAYIADRLL